jgi:hypothetical protein
MSSKSTGHFAAKHPAGTQVAPQISEAVREKLVDQCITCAAAHQIAARLGVAPRDVGIAIDLLEGRLLKCQLGLYGYGEPKKVVQPAPEIDSTLQARILEATVDGRLACVDAWRVADSLGIPRMAVASACETLKIRIRPCQLGAF